MFDVERSMFSVPSSRAPRPAKWRVVSDTHALHHPTPRIAHPASRNVRLYQPSAFLLAPLPESALLGHVTARRTHKDGKGPWLETLEFRNLKHLTPFRHLLIPVLAAVSLLGSCCTNLQPSSAETKDGLLRGAKPVNVEDLCGILGLRLTKFNFPAHSGPGNWNLSFELERGGQSKSKTVHTSAIGGRDESFTVGYRMPANGAEKLRLITGFQPENLEEWDIPNPKCVFRQMRGFDATLIPPGRTVLMVWRNPGGDGWSLDERKFLQRLVIYLR